MPVNINKGQEPPDIKVFIHNTAGQYLAGGSTELFFTNDRSLALVLDYRADRVPEQLELIQKTHGITLVVDPVPLEDIYEMCDRCKDLFVPFMTFFDGKHFLCPDCRKLASRRGAGLNRQPAAITKAPAPAAIPKPRDTTASRTTPSSHP